MHHENAALEEWKRAHPHDTAEDWKRRRDEE
jgi:hypothetical protein